MTIVTKVRVSYVDHMDDDVLEVDITSLSPSPIFEERAWGRG